MSLYSDLGVEREASPEEIRSAFRKRAAKAHPDREGGSEEEFKKVRHAYEVLSDPSRRAEYDKSGSEGGVVDVAQRARQVIAQMLLELLKLEHADDLDLVESLRVSALESAERIRNARDKCLKSEARYRRQAKRLIRKSKAEPNFLANVALAQADQLAKQAAALVEELQLADVVTEQLSDYDCLSPAPSASNQQEDPFNNFISVRRTTFNSKRR